jgi:hypothetical protein
MTGYLTGLYEGSRELPNLNDRLPDRSL